MVSMVRARRQSLLVPAALLAALLTALPAWNPPAAGFSDGRQAPAADFSPNVQVSHGSGSVWSPAVAVDGDGR